MLRWKPRYVCINSGGVFRANSQKWKNEVRRWMQMQSCWILPDLPPEWSPWFSLPSAVCESSSFPRPRQKNVILLFNLRQRIGWKTPRHCCFILHFSVQVPLHRFKARFLFFWWIICSCISPIFLWSFWPLSQWVYSTASLSSSSFGIHCFYFVMT